MIPTALLRTAPSVLRASPAAVERVLWLALVNRTLRLSATDSAETCAAFYVLTRLINRCAPSLYAQTPVDEARETQQIELAGNSVCGQVAEALVSAGGRAMAGAA